MGEIAAPDNPATLRRVKLEEERRTDVEVNRPARARLPEVDLVERRAGGQELEPVPVSQPDPEPHRMALTSESSYRIRLW